MFVGYTDLNVPVDVALLHHYRECEDGSGLTGCLELKASELDRNALAWADDLAPAVEAVCDVIFGRNNNKTSSPSPSSSACPISENEKKVNTLLNEKPPTVPRKNDSIIPQ